jgi:RND superfamily putative drug exporter
MRRRREEGLRMPLLYRIGAFSARGRWWIVLGSLVFLIGTALGSMGITNALESGGFAVPGTEAFRANTMLGQRFQTGDENLVLLVTTRQGTVDSPAVVREGIALTHELAAQAGVAGVTSYWTRTFAPTLRSRDGTQALVLARVNGTDTQARARIGMLSPRFTREDAWVRVRVGGDDAVLQQSGAQSARDLVRVDLISLPILLILLLLIFRSPIAALLPILMGGIVIFGALATLRIIVLLTPISTFALNMVTGLGLGIGVDYSLFLVSRFREELHAGRPVQEAVARSVEKAGRVILFSGLTFGVALAALLISPNFFLASFTYAGLGVIIVGMGCVLLTLPALLAILGERVNLWSIGRRGASATRSFRWHRFALGVMRWSVSIGLAVIVLLVLVGIPFFHIRFGVVDDRILPSSASTRQVQEIIRADFVADEEHALHVVATQVTAPPSQQAEIERYALALSRLPGVVEVDALTGSYAHGQRVAPPEAGSERFGMEKGT